MLFFFPVRMQANDTIGSAFRRRKKKSAGLPKLKGK